MINRQNLLKDLQQQLPKIEQDILAYSESKPELADHLQDEYTKAVEAKRTSEHFVAWREGQITQSAVAWILACVFVRFMEDNTLLDEPLLAGVDERLKHAKQRIEVHFNDNPTHGERDYLLAMFAKLEQLPAIKELLDHQHNPLWQIPVSSDGAKLLVDFFQKIDPQTGAVVHDFTDPEWDTRFLGDLYQELSIAVQKKYALLQTPEFVESFILDYTLEKAIDTFGLKPIRMIDPTCGSGHFLLSGFLRLFNYWLQREPATNTRELAQRALDSVHGVDLNPYAIAICRFRLLIAAMKASGTLSLHQAPDFHLNLAVGDSLLHGKRFEGSSGTQSHLLPEDDPIKHVLEVEDKEQLKKILGQQYHVVVGNPPYITVSDKALNAAYRERFPTCHRKYSLGVPFAERFFDLTFSADTNRNAGYIGMITTNSIMKREFGVKLIENYLPHKDLTHVIDTSGAEIPGHGTPTVILFARNQQPHYHTLRAALGIKGEPSTPKDFSQGLVWKSITNNIEIAGSQNEFISIVDIDRSVISKHPWSLEGGDASAVKKKIEDSSQKGLSEIIDAIGFGTILGEDDAFGVPTEVINSSSLPNPQRPLIEGEYVRNWSFQSKTTVIFPYDENIEFSLTPAIEKWLWPLREYLFSRKAFSGKNYKQSGRQYGEYHQIPKDRNKSKFLITFPFVSTHNHFSLDRGGKLFNRTSPVIKLPNNTNEADHLVLLGLLNSSLACFWGRQVFFPKGGFADGKWEERLEWDGTKLKRFPIPKPRGASLNEEKKRLLEGYISVEQYSKNIDLLAQEFSKHLPAQVLRENWKGNIKDVLSHNHQHVLDQHYQMIAMQEELDWQCYQYYELLDKAYIQLDDLPPVKPGERAFEIALARKVARGEASNGWFVRHNIKSITETPSDWPSNYKELVNKRLQLIDSDRYIKLIGQPEYKRRWLPIEWQKLEQAALKNWLLSYLESSIAGHEAEVLTSATLADRVQNNSTYKEVAAYYMGGDLYDAQKLVVNLIENDQVPQIATSRLKESGERIFRAWQETWSKQRNEDAIDARTKLAEDHMNHLTMKEAEHLKQKEIGEIPVPPKYASKDFAKPNYWKLRGKLDVPKERFFSLPGCEKEGDATLVIGWAGLNHLQRAMAIAVWYIDRKETDNWGKEKLMPMLIALDELIPWLKQWHNEVDPEFGERMGDYYEGYLFGELRELNISREELLNWTPPVVSRTPRKTKKKA